MNHIVGNIASQLVVSGSTLQDLQRLGSRWVYTIVVSIESLRLFTQRTRFGVFIIITNRKGFWYKDTYCERARVNIERFIWMIYHLMFSQSKYILLHWNYRASLNYVNRYVLYRNKVLRFIVQHHRLYISRPLTQQRYAYCIRIPEQVTIRPVPW